MKRSWMAELVRHPTRKHRDGQDRLVVLYRDGLHLELTWLKTRYNLYVQMEVYCSDLSWSSLIRDDKEQFCNTVPFICLALEIIMVDLYSSESNQNIS